LSFIAADTTGKHFVEYLDEIAVKSGVEHPNLVIVVIARWAFSVRFKQWPCVRNNEIQLVRTGVERVVAERNVYNQNFV
jgi:hypothetical protein